MFNEPCAVAETHIAQAQKQTCMDAATKCASADLQELVGQQVHLSTVEQARLLSPSNKNKALFEGLENQELGVFPNRKHHIDLQPNTKPHHTKQPHSIPLHQHGAVKTKLPRKGKLGILI